MTPVTLSWDSVSAVRVLGSGDVAALDIEVTASKGPVAYMVVESDQGAPVFEMPGVGTDELLAVLEPVGSRLVADVHAPPLELELTPLEPEDVELNTIQMTALGLEGLVDKDGRPVEPAPEAVAEAQEPEVESEPDLDVAAEVEPEPERELKSEPEVEPEPEPEAAQETVAEAEPELVDAAKPELVVETELVAEAESESEAEPEAEAEGTSAAEAQQDDEFLAELEEELSIDEASAALEDDRGVVTGDEVIVEELITEEVVLDDDFALDEEPEPQPLVAVAAPAPFSAAMDQATVSAAGVECPNGHTSPKGSRFCLQCGVALIVLRCPNGHEPLPGAAFCGECGADLRESSLEGLEQAVAEATEAFNTMQAAQETELTRWIEKLGDKADRELVDDEQLLPLRKALHEQHIAVKRAELALAEAQVETAPPAQLEMAQGLVEVRRSELDFAIQMLLEVTELIALPRNDEEGKELVRQHMAEIFLECDRNRLAASLRYATARGEPHAIRAAELEIDMARRRSELTGRERRGDVSSEELWVLEGEVLSLRVAQLEERRAASIARGDLAGTDEAEAALEQARIELRAHEQSAPSDATDPAGTVAAEMARVMPTVFTGGQRVPRTTDRRVAVAKRAVAEFRDYFGDNPAPIDGVPEKLLTTLRGEWEEYGVIARQLVGIPVVVPGRSPTRTRVQWIKYDQMIINVWARRINVVSAELEVAVAANDTERAEALRELLDSVNEAVKLSSQAAKVEIPAV